MHTGLKKTDNCAMASAVYEGQTDDFGLVYLYIWTLILLYISVKFNGTSKVYPKISEFFPSTENSK
jgi:hypothetical protein